MVVLRRAQNDIRAAVVVAVAGRRGDAERVLEPLRLPGVVARLRLVDQAGEPVAQAIEEESRAAACAGWARVMPSVDRAAAEHVLQQGDAVHGALGRAADLLPGVHVRAHERGPPDRSGRAP